MEHSRPREGLAGDFDTEVVMSEDSNLEDVVEQIYELIEEGELDAADEALAAAMQAHGQVDELQALQVELALEQEDYDGALAASREALQGVTDPEAIARLKAHQGYALYYLDSFNESRQAFNEAVRADNELLTALVGRAMVHEHMGFYNAAMLDLDRVTEMDDQIGQPFAIRASIHLRWGNVELAEGDLEHAVKMDEEDEESRLNLARLHAINRRTSQALETIGPLVEEGLDPDYVGPAALLRAQLKSSLGNHAAARKDAEVVIELLPDEPWGYLQVAATIISEGVNPGEAIEMLKTAESKVKSARDLPDLYALRASAYEQMGKPEKAAELRADAEGVARLPGFVYGPLNPVGNIPVNPNKPIDIRALLDDLFGEASSAPDGYENVLREIIAKIPQIAKEHPDVGQIQIDLPEAPGMVGGKRQLVVSLAQARKSG